jgi:AmmeMemoRadiSam system protein B
MITRTVALLLLGSGVTGTPLASAQEVRPIKDDVGFCWDASQMKRLVDYLREKETIKEAAGPIVAGISPHDDYLYAGRVYYPLFRALHAKEVVIFGVTHGTVRKEIGDPKNVVILETFKRWKGLSGDIEPSPLRDILLKTLPAKSVLVSNRAHKLEHSIEALIPFLQQYDPEIRITPVMVTAMPFEAMETLTDTLSSVVAAYLKDRGLALGRDIAFLVSSDANHYGRDFQNTPFGEDDVAHRKGTALDRQLVEEYLVGEMAPQKVERLVGELWGENFAEPKGPLWCGRYSVPFGMLAICKIVKKSSGRELEGHLLRYSDTYTGGVIPLEMTGMGLTAPFSLKHWVGFFSLAYTLK